MPAIKPVSMTELRIVAIDPARSNSLKYAFTLRAALAPAFRDQRRAGPKIDLSRIDDIFFILRLLVCHSAFRGRAEQRAIGFGGNAAVDQVVHRG
jgi:hypothetical protein